MDFQGEWTLGLRGGTISNISDKDRVYFCPECGRELTDEDFVKTGDGQMNRHNKMINEQLAAVVERFITHSEMKKISENPIVRDGARNMCDIELWEMWALTQI